MDLPGGAVVKTLLPLWGAGFFGGNVHMIPGWGIKISHAPGQKGKKKRERENEDDQWSNTTGMVMTGKGITRFDNQEIPGEL